MIENSFGTIPVKKENNQYFILLIQHVNGGHWGFPKGHAEPNETSKQAAVRELKEETNLNLSKFLYDKPLIENYIFIKDNQTVRKTVEYYLVEVSGDILFQGHEVLKGGWFSLSQARERLTFQESKKLLDKILGLLDIEVF